MAYRHDAATDHVLRLRDGRRMGYSVFGDPDGFPVLNCHGGLLCRLDVEPAANDFQALGARVVSPDRPGVATSDRHPGHSTGDWADDVRELLDTLYIERCAVMGWSLGGQYAAAVAARLPDRVSAAAIIAGCLPLDDPTTFAQLNKDDRRLTRLSTQSAPLARIVFAASAQFARRAPQRFAHFQAKSWPEPDSAVMTAEAEWFAHCVTDGLRDSAGMVDEYRAFVGPWGFAVDAITAPLHVYQGTDDTMVPAAWAAELHRRVPGSALTTYADEAHFIVVSHRSDIVRDLLAAST